ncbi:MAG TPA: diphthine--ammonia ligase [Candidatus Bathyarchaeota archaeon]|nr:diphthine--ammonia ligase [Candidatus Bathyarchaeota archaeon]
MKGVKMCGIAGYFGENWENILRKALNLMKHRGRDSLKIEKVEKGGIGYLLHSISGFVPQPLIDGDFWFVGNLEIYNWRDIADKFGIEAENDAELAFELLMRKGVSACRLFSGQYAIAFSDSSKIYLIRDRVGIAPLFYSVNPFSFASERKAFPKLRELHPRYSLIFEDGEIETLYRGFFTGRKVKDPVKELDRALREAVRRRIWDEQWLLFSGGVDSALLASYLIEEGANFKAIVVGLERSPDIVRAEKVAREMNIKLEKIVLKRETILKRVGKICKLIESSDPVKVEASLVTYFASLNCPKVAFSGIGADEIFGGQARMHRSRTLECIWALRNIYERSTYTNNVCGFAGGTELRFPYLDEKVIEISIGLDDSWKEDKKILRELAKIRGIKGYLEHRKAPQHGSGISTIIPKPKPEYLSKFWPKNIKLGALISGGKDSWYALHIMHRLNYEIACIISILPRKESMLFHVPMVEMVREQAKAAGIPLIMKKAGENEEEILRKVIEEAVNKFSIEGVVSGAISSQYQRKRFEDACEKTGVASFSPLWGVDQKTYLRKVCRELKFIIVEVAAEGLEREWVGKEIGPSEAESLITLSKKYGFNPAGEGGEYETFVIDAPLFSKPIRLELEKI